MERLDAREWSRRSESLALFGRDDCVSCTDSPSCNCASDESCVLTSRTCSQCPQIQCIKSASSGSSSINPAIIAVPIVAVLVIASLALFWWLRRKKRRDLARLEDLAERARKGESSAFHLSQPNSPVPPPSTRRKSGRVSQLLFTPAPPHPTQLTHHPAQRSPLPSVPADAEYYDENGAMIRVYSAKRGVINADPNHPDNGGMGGGVFGAMGGSGGGGPVGDPFSDGQSISTVQTGESSSNSTNVIPIHFVPRSQSDESLAHVLTSHRDEDGAHSSGLGNMVAQQAAAARALDQARQNLWRPAMPPQRPARSPDLDLRLAPPSRPPFGGPSSSRDSVLSSLSSTPSFLSGNTADLHLDAPKIITSRQVQIGRLQPAEMVQFGRGQGVGSAAAGVGSLTGALDPFSERDSRSPTGDFLDVPSPRSPATFGSYSGSFAASDLTGETIGETSAEGDEGLSQPSPTDLRFSMGSLAYDRNSVSTMDTAPRSLPGFPSRSTGTPDGRMRFESISSYKSLGADSLLGSFPMIPPAYNRQSQLDHPSVPQSSSTLTLDMPVMTSSSALPPPPGPRPPTAFKSSPSRPVTAASTHSVADSFLSGFPFVPPNVDGNGMPSAALPSAAVPDTAKPGATSVNKPGRLTLGMSTASEGLGDFDFSFDSVPPVPHDRD